MLRNAVGDGTAGAACVTVREMRVSARNAAIVAGLIAGLYLAVVFSIRRVPDGIVAALGGPSGIARDGGLVLRYRPPAGYDAARFGRSAARRGAAVRREDGRIIVEIIGVPEVEARHAAAIMTGGGLEFREVIEDMGLFKVPHETRGRDDFVAPGVRLELDQWRDEDGGRWHSDSYLLADRREQLEDAFAQVRAVGWPQPPHTIVAFERFEAGHGRRAGTIWRSYLLGDEVVLDGDAVASALPSNDPNTGRPVVLLEFDRRGAERFGDVTARIVGHKLATVLGGQVQSAPIINGPIRGGRASITTGGDDLATQERERDTMVAALSTVSLPPDGVVEDQRWIAPEASAGSVALARFAIGFAGGVLIGLLVGLAVRVARPVWLPGPRRRPGRLPLRRVAVTLLAPVAVLVLGGITWPGINDVELGPVLPGRTAGLFTVGELGVAPILGAFVLVELATLLVSRWRHARQKPAMRLAIGRYVAGLGLVLALVQSYFLVEFAAGLERGGVALLAPGMSSHVAAIASLTTGTMLLVIVAGMIRQHGLGNGYGAVIVSAWAIAAARRIVEAPVAGHALGLVTLAAISCATIAMLRMRIGDDREAPLRVPSSGMIPFHSGESVVALWSLIRFGAAAAIGGASIAGGGGMLALGWYRDCSRTRRPACSIDRPAALQCGR